MFGHFYRLIDIHIMWYKIVSNRNAKVKSVHNIYCSYCCKLLQCNTCNTTTNTLSRVRMCPPIRGFSLCFPGTLLFGYMIKMCLFIKTQAYKYVNDKINTVKSM